MKKWHLLRKGVIEHRIGNGEIYSSHEWVCVSCGTCVNHTYDMR
jgi:hypothetical protein